MTDKKIELAKALINAEWNRIMLFEIAVLEVERLRGALKKMAKSKKCKCHSAEIAKNLLEVN